MKKLGLMCGVLFGLATACVCQPQHPRPNVVLVTLDGFRWQELFEGADSILLDKHSTTFWHSDPVTRRKILMPFVWSEVATNGQLLGNRNFNNRVDCDNPHWFSYPGYNEMLTGFIDRRIKSNGKIENPNMTVFEYILQRPGFEEKVAAFGTWDVFPFIFRKELSRIPVRGGSDDQATAAGAIDYMQREHPKAVFIGLDETDSYAHQGMYDKYLDAAHRNDALIKELWTFIQSDAFYKDNTTLIITTDHGRGRGRRGEKRGWKSHGRLAFGSGEVWVAAIGPGVPPAGEITTPAKSTLSQVASTIAAVLGLNYSNERPVAEPFPTIVPKTGKAIATISK